MPLTRSTLAILPLFFLWKARKAIRSVNGSGNRESKSGEKKKSGNLLRQKGKEN